MTVLLVLFLGACVGSFFTCLADRIAFKESIFSSRSFCFSCRKQLKIQHIIPIFSYIFLRSRCAFCGASLSSHLFLSELFCALCFCFALFFSHSFYDFLVLAFILCTLYCLSLLDLRLKAVPEFLLFFLVLLSFLYAFVTDLSLFSLFEDSFFLRFFIFAGFVFFIKFISSFFINFKKYDEKLESMGEADILVLASMAGILGIWQGFYIMFLSSLLALCFFVFLKLYHVKNYEMPMIPFFAVSFMIVFVGSFYEISL
ncbi:A24 family peptidase [uncultured Campylobacter sp.]|uniref:prepilin peptidase n=1 Tax=uncultured Campylobacter sp. TaxID=218934 RepID=UPI0026210D6B|nr:A24 family peptidase [uncultured Campylobacter sp.]